MAEQKPKFTPPVMQLDQTWGQQDIYRTGTGSSLDPLNPDIRNGSTQWHTHDGKSERFIELNGNLNGLFETVSSVPTAVPTTPYGQIKIYTNGATYRLYWYDSTNGAWRYATGT